MVQVNCENTECIFCSQDKNCLYKSDIWIGDVYYGGCSEYWDYRETEDYKTVFWKSWITTKQKGKYGRKKAMGKRILINGREFFTESNPNYDEENTVVTDGETGVFLGSIKYIKDHWEEYMKKVREFKESNYSNVLKLPIVVEAEEKQMNDIGREILFRGKKENKKEWVYGYLVKRPSAICIGETNPWAINVPSQDPDDGGGEFWVKKETVGRYTGIKDKNGKHIFEGDILRCVSEYADNEYITEVWAEGNTLCVNVEGFDYDYTAIDFAYKNIWKNEKYEIEVIGNIHDDNTNLTVSLPNQEK